MERLTTNKPVAEMGMYELAHNSCYMDGERKARYRDFEQDIDAREFTRILCKDLEYLELSKDDDEFDNEIMEALAYGPEDIFGLIALFYRNLWAMANLYEKLKRYEEMEEKGAFKNVACCKDCECFEAIACEGNKHFCNKYGGHVTENDYCSRPSVKRRLKKEEYQHGKM